jgi:hypothetical protein
MGRMGSSQANFKARSVAFVLEEGSFTSGSYAAIRFKNYLILAPVFALISLKMIKLRSANYFPYQSDTSRSSKSDLLASKAIITHSPL